MSKKLAVEILIELSNRLADEADYDEDIAPKIQQVIDYIEALKKPTWQGLTDDEISALRIKLFDAVATNLEVYRAIEQALKEKNCENYNTR